jgi:uridylate kinase
MILGQRNANPMRNTRACQRAARVRAETIIEASRISHVFLCVCPQRRARVAHSLKNLIISRGSRDEWTRAGRSCHCRIHP